MLHPLHLLFSASLCATLLSGATHAGDVLLELDGSKVNEVFGNMVRPAGDVNADGVCDLLVGSLYGPTGLGRVQVFSGVDGALLHVVDGLSTNDGTGFSGCTAGDVDGDGHDDFVVGSMRDDTLALDIGAIRVYSGATGEVLLTASGKQHGENFGRSVAPAGDVNDDGVIDLLVGSWFYTSEGLADRGRAVLLSGVDLELMHEWLGEGANDYMGIEVRAAGDVDDDGTPDLFVGAAEYYGHAYENGQAYVYSGVTWAPLYVFEGDDLGDLFGHSITSLGDVDLDGVVDLAVGAYADDDFGSKSGTARTFSGADGSVLQTVYGDFSDDRLGYSVDRLDDMNGDGIPELLTCAYRTDHVAASSGSVYVFEPTLGTQLAIEEGPEAGALFGQSMCALPDLDGDGFPEIFVGISKFDGVGTDSGRVQVISVTPWHDLGEALGGALGDPLLEVGGSLLPGSLLTATTTNLPASTAAHLVIGAGLLGVPFKGGVIVPTVDVIVRKPTGAFGVHETSLVWPVDAPSGSEIYFQTWTIDPTAPEKFSASNAVFATSP